MENGNLKKWTKSKLKFSKCDRTSKNDCDFSRSPGLEILVDEATDERPGLL